MFNLIIKTMKEFVDIDESKVNEDTHFILDLHLTSYDIVSMIGVLEDDLGVEIPDRKIRDLDTVGALVKYLEEKLV